MPPARRNATSPKPRGGRETPGSAQTPEDFQRDLQAQPALLAAAASSSGTIKKSIQKTGGAFKLHRVTKPSSRNGKTSKKSKPSLFEAWRSKYSKGELAGQLAKSVYVSARGPVQDQRQGDRRAAGPQPHGSVTLEDSDEEDA